MGDAPPDLSSSTARVAGSASGDRPVVVVGGGIAGLVAAYALGKKGVKAVVLEADARVGGRAWSDVETIGGRQFVFHHGAQMSSQGYGALVEIIEELGLSSHLVENTRLTSILFGGELVQIDDRNVYSTKGTVLTDEEWWDYGQQAFLHWNRQLRGRSIADPEHWLDLEGKSAATLEDDLGQGPARLLNGIIHAFYFQHPEDVTRAIPLSLWKTLIDDEAPQSLRGGFGTLIDALVAKIGDVRVNKKVEWVEPTPDGVKVTVDGAVIEASDVVIATTADRALEIYGTLSQAELDLLDVAYRPTINVALDVDKDWHDHRALAGTYGIRVPVNEMGATDVIASISLESGRLCRRTPGHETLQIMLDARRAAALLDEPDDAICNRVVGEADRKKLLPGIAQARLNRHRVFKIRSAIPATPPGRFEVIRRYEESLSAVSRVKFAGDFRGFPRVGSAALAGAAAAEETLNARSARARRSAAATKPARPARKPSTPGDELTDAVQGYRAAVGCWAESVVRLDVHGATNAWINGWRFFFNGMDAAARTVGVFERR